MTACIHRLRTALAGLLAVALLLGPCLSISGFTGSGTAHAHAEQNAADAFDHETHGHGGHGAMQGDSGSDAPPGCEQMCDGWAVQKSKQDIFKHLASFDDRDDSPAGILLSDRTPTGPPTLERSLRVPVAQDAWLAGVCSYALTSRYRL